MVKQDLNENIIGSVAQRFEGIASAPAGKKELGRYEHTIVFDLSDADAILIHVRSGAASVHRGSIGSTNILTTLVIKTDMQTLRALIEKRITLGEALFLGKAVAYGSTVKEYAIAWLSGLLRTDFDRNP
jgi:hypothetical protein